MKCELKLYNKNNEFVGAKQPNNTQSKLFKDLSKKFKEDKDTDFIKTSMVYGYINSNEFKDKYGDWTIENKLYKPAYISNPKNIINKEVLKELNLKGTNQNTINVKLNEEVFNELRSLTKAKDLRQNNDNVVSITFNYNKKKLKVSFLKDSKNKSNQYDLEGEANVEDVFNKLFSNDMVYDSLQPKAELDGNISLNNNKELSMNSIDYLLKNDQYLINELNKLYEERQEKLIDNKNLSKDIQEAIESSKTLQTRLDQLKKNKKTVLLQFENVKKIFASKIYNHKLGLIEEFDSNLNDVELVYQVIEKYLTENDESLDYDLKNIFYKKNDGELQLNEKILYGIHVEINNELKKLNINLKGDVKTLETQYEDLLEQDIEDTNETVEDAEKHGANKYDLKDQGFNFIDKKLRAFIEYTTYKEKDIVEIKEKRRGPDEVIVRQKGQEKLINAETVFRLLQMYMSKEYNSKSDLNFDELFLMLSLENEQTKALYDKYIKALSTNPNIREMFIRELNTIAINHITLLNDPEALKSRVFSSNLNDYDKIQFDQWNSSWQIIKSTIVTKKTDGSFTENSNFKEHIDKINKIKERFSLIQTSLTPKLLNKYLDDFLSPISDYNIENATGIKLSRMYLKYSILKSLNEDQINNLNLSDAELKMLNVDIEKHFIGKPMNNLILKADFFEIFSDLAKSDSSDYDPFNTSYKEVGILTPSKKPKANSEMTYRIKNIALANSVFDETIIQTSFRNAANDLLHGFSKPGYLTKAVKTLSDKAHREQLKKGLDKRYINPKIIQRNTLLNLDEDVQNSLMNDMQLMYINNITQSALTNETTSNYDTPEGSDYKNITAKVYNLTSLSYFLDRKKYRALYKTEAGSKIYIDRFLLNPYILETSNTSHGVLMPVGLPSTTLSKSLETKSFIKEKDNVLSMSDTVLNLFANKAITEYDKIQDRKLSVLNGIEDYFKFILDPKSESPKTALYHKYDVSINKNNDKGKRVKLGKAFNFFLFKNMIDSSKSFDIKTMSKEFKNEMVEFEKSLNDYFDKLLDAENAQNLEKVIEKSRNDVNINRGAFLNNTNKVKAFKNAYQEYIDSEYNKWVNNALIKENLAEYKNDELVNILVAENVDQQGAFNESLNIIETEYDGNFSKMLYDYFINNTFWTMDFNELVSGDMAVRKDSTDYNKRIKGGASSGSQLAEGEIKVAYIQDPTFVHKTLGELEVADAQSYSTVSRYQEIVRYQGRLTKDVSGVIQKIKLGLPITYAEREILDLNKATANPVKDLYYNVNIFHKDSVAFLLPELTSYIPTANQNRYDELVNEITNLETYEFMAVNPTSEDGIARYNAKQDENSFTYEELSQVIKNKYKELDSLWQPRHDYLHDLRLNMERDGIEIAIPYSASKLLSKVTVDPIEDNSTSNMSKNFNLNYSAEYIDGAYWREVVEVNSGKKNITYFSQIMRLIEGGHGNDPKSSLLLSQNGDITDVQTELDEYRKKIGSKRVKSFMSAINVLQLEDGQYTNESVNLFYEKLQSTLKSSGGSQLMIELFENPNIDKNIPVTSEKFIQLFLAHFNKGTLKQKATGLKLTLFSSEGLEVIETIDKDGNSRIINSIELEEIKQKSLDKLNDPNLDIEKILEEIEDLELKKLEIEEDDISYDDKIRNVNNEIKNLKLLINSEYDEIMKARSVVTYSVDATAEGTDKISYEEYDTYEEIEEEVIVGYETEPQINKKPLSYIKKDKKVLTNKIIPKNYLDNAKAKAKAKISNKFIGFGVTIGNKQGATYTYQIQAGSLANLNDYNTDDVVFVSVPGKRKSPNTEKSQNDTVNKALSAIEQGAALIADDIDYIFTDRNAKHDTDKSISYYEKETQLYNIGEIKLYKALTKKGYKSEQINVDGQKLTLWRKYTSEEINNLAKEENENLILEQVKKESAAEIYNKLGNKTVTNNVQIVEAYQIDAKNRAKKEGAITAMRFKSNTHFGNPFSSKTDENGNLYDKKRLDKIKKDFPETVFVETVQEAVEKYIDWILNSGDNRANWIRSVLKSGQLKGKKIHYYKELNQPSHATALDYLINEYDWNAETEQGFVNAKVEQVADGIKIIRNGITKSEELELFDYLKPYLESQASKTNKGANAPLMIGLGLRWDYTANNPNNKPVDIGPAINNSSSQTNKYRYYDVAANGEPLGPISDRLKELVTKATGIDASDYDGAIINVYPENGFISAHNDVDESASAINYPVLVLNIGGDGNLSIEGSESQKAKKSYNSKEYTQNDLKSGDAYIFGEDGLNRDVYHRTLPSDGKGTLPELNIQGKKIPANSYRITITLRRVRPLTKNMPNKPKKVNSFLTANNYSEKTKSNRKPIYKTVKKKVKTGTEVRKTVVPFVAEKNRNEQNTVLLDGTTIRRRRLRYSKPELTSDFIFRVPNSKSPIVVKTDAEFLETLESERVIRLSQIRILRSMISQLKKIEKADISEFGKLYQQYENYKKELDSNTLKDIEEFIKKDFENNSTEYLAEDLQLAFNIGDVTKQGFSEIMIPRYESFQYNISSEEFQSKVQQEALKVFGGRIPSQEWHSMISAKVVDFLPSAMGDTAAAPHEIIALSGADFDIDSIYLIRKSITNLKGIDRNGNEVNVLYEFGTNLTRDQIISIKANELIKEEIANMFLEKTTDPDYLEYLMLNNQIQTKNILYKTLSQADKKKHSDYIKARDLLVKRIKRNGKGYLFQKNKILTDEKYTFPKILENIYAKLNEEYDRNPEQLAFQEKEIKYKLFIKTYIKTDPRIKFEIKTELEKSKVLGTLENELEDLKSKHKDKLKEISKINKELFNLGLEIENLIEGNEKVSFKLKLKYGGLINKMTNIYSELNSSIEQQFRLSKAIDNTSNDITVKVMESNGLSSVEDFTNNDNPLALHNQIVDANINLYNDPNLVNIASYNENDPDKKTDVGSTQSPAVMYKIQGTGGKKKARNANGLLVSLVNVGDMFTEKRDAQSVNNYDMFTPNGRLIAFKSNKIASKLIGPAAIAKILRAKLEALKVATPKVIWDGKELNQGFGAQVSHDVEFKEIRDSNTNEVIDYEIIVHNNDENNPIVFRIDDELSTLISVVTDAPKWNDPYKLQLAFETFGTYLYLISIGAGSNRAMTLAQMSFIQMLNEAQTSSNHQIIRKEEVFQKKGKNLLLGPVNFNSNGDLNGGLFTAMNIMIRSTSDKLGIKENTLEIETTKYSNILNYNYDPVTGAFNEVKNEDIIKSGDNIFNNNNNRVNLKNNAINIELDSKDLFDAVNSRNILNNVLVAIGRTELDLEFHDLKPKDLLEIINSFSQKVVAEPTPTNKVLYSEVAKIVDTNFKAVMFYEQANTVSTELLNFVNILQIDKGLKPSYEEIDKVNESMNRLGINVITLKDEDFDSYQIYRNMLETKTDLEIQTILAKFKKSGSLSEETTDEEKEFYFAHQKFRNYKDIQPVVYDEFNEQLKKEADDQNFDEKYYIAIQKISTLYVDYTPVIKDPIVQGNLVAIHKIRNEISPKMILTRNNGFTSILREVLGNEETYLAIEDRDESLRLGSGNAKIRNKKYLEKQLLVYFTKKVLYKNNSNIEVNPGLLFDLYNKHYEIEEGKGKSLKFVNNPSIVSSEMINEQVEDVLYNKFLKAVSENERLKELHITKLISSPTYKKDNYRSPIRFGIESFITKSDALSAQLQSDLLVIKEENEGLYNDIINYLLTKDGLLMANESLISYIGEDVFIELSKAIQQLRSADYDDFMKLVSKDGLGNVDEIVSEFLDLLMTTNKGVSFLPKVVLESKNITKAVRERIDVNIIEAFDTDVVVFNSNSIGEQKNLLNYDYGVKYFKTSYTRHNKTITDVYRKIAILPQKDTDSHNIVYMKMPKIDLTKDVSPFAFDSLYEILDTETIILKNAIKEQFTKGFLSKSELIDNMKKLENNLNVNGINYAYALLELDYKLNNIDSDDLSIESAKDVKDVIESIIDNNFLEDDRPLEFLQREVELKDYIEEQTNFIENADDVANINYQVYTQDGSGNSLLLKLNNSEIVEVPKNVNTLEDLKDTKLTSNSILFISEKDYNNPVYKEAIIDYFNSYTVIIQSTNKSNVTYKSFLGDKFIDVTEHIFGIPETFTVMGNDFNVVAITEETIANGIKTDKDYNTDFLEENKLKLSNFKNSKGRKVQLVENVLNVMPSTNDKNLYVKDRIESYKNRNKDNDITSGKLASTLGGRFLLTLSKSSKINKNTTKGDFIKIKFKDEKSSLIGKLKSNPFKISKNINDVESINISMVPLLNTFSLKRKNNNNLNLTSAQVEELKKKGYESPNNQKIKKVSGEETYDISAYNFNAEAWIRVNMLEFDKNDPGKFYKHFEKLVNDVYSQFFKLNEFRIRRYINENGGLAFIDSMNFSSNPESKTNIIKRNALKNIYTSISLERDGFVYDSLSTSEVQELMVINKKRATTLLNEKVDNIFLDVDFIGNIKGNKVEVIKTPNYSLLNSSYLTSKFENFYNQKRPVEIFNNVRNKQFKNTNFENNIMLDPQTKSDYLTISYFTASNNLNVIGKKASEFKETIVGRTFDVATKIQTLKILSDVFLEDKVDKNILNKLVEDFKMGSVLTEDKYLEFFKKMNDLVIEHSSPNSEINSSSLNNKISDLITKELLGIDNFNDIYNNVYDSFDNQIKQLKDSINNNNELTDDQKIDLLNKLNTNENLINDLENLNELLDDLSNKLFKNMYAFNMIIKDMIESNISFESLETYLLERSDMTDIFNKSNNLKLLHNKFEESMKIFENKDITDLPSTC